MRRRILSILALAAVSIVTSLVDTGLASPNYPLRELLKRAETVLVVRIASHTETDAVFEVTQVLRGDATLQKLSLGRSLAGRDLPKNTQSLLLFSQGDNSWGPPKDSFQVGQPIKRQASYRGWILMDGPGESKEELDRLTELVKQNPFSQSQPDRRKAKTAKEAEATPGTTKPAGQPAVDAAGRRLSDKTMEAVKQLKGSVDIPAFSVCLYYYGPGRGEAVDSLYMSMTGDDIDNPGDLAYAWLPKKRAVAIIDHLAELGFFDRAKEVDPQKTPPAAGIPKGPTYVLMVRSIRNEKAHCYYLDLGWNRQMLQFLDGFRKGLVGEEAKAMDKLLAQLQPERKRWQAAEEAKIERLLSIRAAKWSDAEGREAHKKLVAMGADAIPSLLICFKKAANRDPRVRDPQAVSDFGTELRAALYALAEIGDRRALPAISALVKYDNKPGRMQGALEDILAKGSDQQLWVDMRSDDPNIAGGAQRILVSPGQYGRAERREPRESEADAIVVGRAVERRGEATVVKVSKTLKGGKTPERITIPDSRYGRRLHLDPEKQWICYLRVDGHGRGVPLIGPILRSEWYTAWTEKTESDVLAAIPLPTEWGPPVSGVQIGLRVRAEEVPAGADVLVEIAIRNTGKKPIELPQHRFNIYDYYPRTRFAVTDEAGRRTLLAKPVTDMDESDRTLMKSLAPGEVYIHTVRLNRWPVAPEELDRQNARNPLGLPGSYTIECTYADPPNTSRPLTLTAAPVKVTITAPEKAAPPATQREEGKKAPAARQDSPPATEPEDVCGARASVATLVTEAVTLRKDRPKQWAQWDKAVADVLAKHAAMVKDWGGHARPPAPDIAPLELPMAYLVWHWRDASTDQRLPAAYGLGEMYLRAIADSGDQRRIDILLQVLGGSEWGGKLLVKAMATERVEPSIRELLAGTPKLKRDAPLHMLLREFAAGLSPAVRKAGYDWLRSNWPQGPSNGDGEKYWETLFRLDLDRARREVIPYYGQRYNRTDRYDLYVLFALLAHGGPSEEVAHAVRRWRKTPDEFLDFYRRRVLVCADPEGELDSYVADIEAQFKSGQRPDELPYLVRTLVEHIPRQSVKYLRQFANDRRLTGLMGQGTRKKIVWWLVEQQDEQAEKIVARWLAEEDEYAQGHLIDVLARQSEFARGLLKKARPGIDLPPLPIEKAPPPATQPGSAGTLSARIMLPEEVTPTNGLFPAKLELTNNGKQPIRLATLCQVWRSSSKGAFHVSLQPDRWKSDQPTVAQSAKSAVELSPGESATLPFEIIDRGGETLHVTASYAVSEEFAKKLNVWSGFVQPVRVVLKRVKKGKLRIFPSDQFPLPGTQVSIERAFRQPEAFAAVCVAVSDARALGFWDLLPDGVTAKSQVFKVAEVLAGRTAAADDATFDYFVLDRPGAHERTIRKGERVIWVARPWTDGDVGVKGRPTCLKVLSDTPENRRAVRVAHANRRALPGSRTPLQAAIRGGFAFVAACEALEDTQGEIGARGKLSCTQEFQVHQLLAGDGPGVGRFRLHYTYGDVQECCERAVRKRERVIWIVREKPGDVPPWHGAKVLPDTPENRAAVKSLAPQATERTSPPPSRNEGADILDYAAKHPRNVVVREPDGTSRRPQYGDVRLERAEEALKNYAKPWTVKKVLSWYKETKDGKTRAHLLRVLAASRHPKAAIELGKALDDSVLDVRVTATYGLLDYFLPDTRLVDGGTESHMIAAAKWWQENRQRLLSAASTQPDVAGWLSARIVLPEEVTPTKGLFPAKLELTNNGKQPIRLVTLCQAWRSSRKGVFHVSFTPGQWKSDQPPVEQIAKSVVELSPGESTTLPFEVVDGGDKTLQVTASYAVPEWFAKKLNVWSGSFVYEPARVILKRVKEGKLRVASEEPGDLPPFPLRRAMVREKVSQLIEKLENPDPQSRREAIYGLANLGSDAKEAVPALVRRLEDEDGQVRSAAASSFYQILPPHVKIFEVFPEWRFADKNPATPELMSPGERVRFAKATAVANKEAAKAAEVAVPALIEVLTDEGAYARENAARSLGACGPHARRAVRPLIGSLEDESEAVRMCAVTALGKIGPDAKEAVPELIAYFKKYPRYGVGTSAIRSLGNIGSGAKEAVPFLIELLQDRGEPRSLAAVALGGIGPEAKAAVPALIAALEDPERLVRASAAEALGKIAADMERVVPALRKAEMDKDSYVRTRAGRALDSLTRLLGKQLRSKDWNEEAAAIRSTNALIKDCPRAELHKLSPLVEPLFSKVGWGGIGHDRANQAAELIARIGKPAVPFLLEKLRSSESHDRWCAVEILGRIGEPDAPVVSVVRPMLHDEDAYVRRVAIDTLAALGNRAGPAVKDLEKALTDSSPNNHIRGHAALIRITGEAGGHIEAIAEHLKSRDVRESEASFAAATLGGFGAVARPVESHLRAALKHPHAQVRVDAAGALGAIGADSEETIVALIGQLRNDPDPVARRSSAYALGTIGPAAKAAVPALSDILNSEDVDKALRRTAAEAIKRIRQPAAPPDANSANEPPRRPTPEEQLRPMFLDGGKLASSRTKKAVYFCPSEGQLSPEDLAAHPSVVVATKFDEVKAVATELVAIWIDKDAVKDVDLEWLHKPPQKYYPIVLVGYRNALYSFRDALSGFGLAGPEREWEKVTLSPGFSIWMKSAIVQGYEDAPTVAGILKITAPLLEKSLASDAVPWGKVSNGLQCRLSPDTQKATVPQGAKPEEIEIYVRYDVRNAGDRALRFSTTGTPLWLTSPFYVTGPDGKPAEYTGPRYELPPPGPPVELDSGEILRREKRLEYDFTRPGRYLVSTLKISLPGGQEVLAYYGNDADKAGRNPDNVWTGSLVSNTVTVEIVAGKNPEHALLPGSHLTLQQACGEEFQLAAVVEAVSEANEISGHTSGDKPRSSGRFVQEFRCVDVIVGKRLEMLDTGFDYLCERGAGERPIRKGERVIWIFQRLGGKDGRTVLPAKALPVTATNIEAVVDAVQGMKRWGPASGGIQAGIRCKAVIAKPEPAAVLVCSVRNVGTKPVRLPCRSRSIEVTVNGELYPFCGPQADPLPPPRIDSFIELAPGAVDSAEVRILAVNRGLEDFRGAEMTFVYANDSATAIASPFDQASGKWKQVTGLWTGTIRSGTIKLNAAEAKEESTSSEQPSPIRASRGVFAQEHFELKPISGQT